MRKDGRKHQKKEVRIEGVMGGWKIGKGMDWNRNTREWRQKGNGEKRRGE